eukprot:GFUD01006852.1.p1 GENE.GFUD01006852.1~~GFUD01006852.1.p1  ORF type:complete len:425 (-),score=72.46 GFUD01006852.1:207-1367(-)
MLVVIKMHGYIFCTLLILLPLSSSCNIDVDCSLNGICQSNKCICDSPWTGSTCSLLNQEAVKFPQGYGQSPNLTSWGGSILTDPLTGQHHLFVSTLTNSCPLLYWQTNSRIDHAVSDTITGPYQFKDVAVSTWATNPATIALADGTYAIVHIGQGDGPPDGGEHCRNDIPLHSEHTNSTGSTIHISQSLSGPWEPLANNTLGSCNNPSPWQHKNGSLYIVCAHGDHHVLKKAASISGPWTDVSNITINHTNTHTYYEDPFLWIDSRNMWHLLMHSYNTKEDRTQCSNSTVSVHVFSKDGYEWKLGKEQPYTTQVAVEHHGGSYTITVATRERPKLLFSPSGSPSHLVTAVCSAPSCPDGPPTGCVDCKYEAWDYTLVSPLVSSHVS